MERTTPTALHDDDRRMQALGFDRVAIAGSADAAPRDDGDAASAGSPDAAERAGLRLYVRRPPMHAQRDAGPVSRRDGDVD
jgi:hypothetical protein